MRPTIYITRSPKAKVQFINQLQAKVELENGDLYTIGFRTPYNFFAGEEFIQIAEQLFDVHMSLEREVLSNAIRTINSELYLNGFEMILLAVQDQDKEGDRKRIGDRIKELRKKKNIDAKFLAAQIGIDASNLSRIEQGRYSVGLDILSKNCQCFRCKS